MCRGRITVPCHSNDRLERSEIRRLLFLTSRISTAHYGAAETDSLMSRGERTEALVAGWRVGREGLAVIGRRIRRQE